MEHLADPVAFLRSQLGLLKPGGRIVFEVPNANDALTVLYEIPAYARFIWVVSHRWYFTEKSLAATIAKAGGRGEVRLDQRYDLSNHHRLGAGWSAWRNGPVYTYARRGNRGLIPAGADSSARLRHIDRYGPEIAAGP